MNKYNGLIVPIFPEFESLSSYCNFIVERGFCKGIDCTNCLFNNQAMFEKWMKDRNMAKSDTNNVIQP